VIRLAVRVSRDHAEPVLAELLDLVPGGLEEREVDAGTVEYVLYGAAGELPDLPDVRAAAGGALVDVSTSELPDDWDERWRTFHRPVDVRGLRVRPPWEPPRPGALDVVIDPGQAFGTGSHATTRLTLELLAELEPAGALADWGCGSGVLAVCAAKLGWGPVSGCDVEVASVAATQVAAQANGVSVEVTRCDVRRGGPWAPTVLANLVRPLLLEVAANLQRPPGRMIISGLQADETDEVVAAFARTGLREAARREGEGWAAVRLEGEAGGGS
jgi:ribosomal protein L11 methyltransferase